MTFQKGSSTQSSGHYVCSRCGKLPFDCKCKSQSVRHTTTTAQREMHKYAGEIARNIDAAYILCSNLSSRNEDGICNGAVEGCAFCHVFGGVKICYLENYQNLSEILQQQAAGNNSRRTVRDAR